MTDEAAYVRAYARALFGAARAADALPATTRDLAAVMGVLAESVEQRRWIARRAPASQPRRAAEVRERLGSAAGTATLRLLVQMAAWHHLHLIPAVARRFESLVRAAAGRGTAQVVFAQPATEAALAALRIRLGADEHQLDFEVRTDPSLLAGLTVRIGDRVLDASLAGRLARLRQALINPARAASVLKESAP